MAKFTVHRNKNARSKAIYPFVVAVQSDRLDELQTRVATPLTEAAALREGPAAGSLAARRDTILAAMDFLITGF